MTELAQSVPRATRVLRHTASTTVGSGAAQSGCKLLAAQPRLVKQSVVQRFPKIGRVADTAN
jgi:hypothetical protein